MENKAQGGAVLFCGSSGAEWDACAPSALRRAVRRCAPALPGAGWVLVEVNTVFGFCALQELLALRQSRPFLLAALCREEQGFAWLRGAAAQRMARGRQLLRMLARCDRLESSLTPADWAELLRSPTIRVLDEATLLPMGGPR